jgi:CheY-like chemotaxis protein
MLPVPLVQVLQSVDYELGGIDDDSQAPKLFLQILASAKYSVVAANSGQVALQILHEKPVDLVVLDSNMPKPDGFEILKAIRSQRPDLKILVISGYVSGPLLKASELVGDTASLSKTDVPRHLVKAVNRLLGSPREETGSPGD